MKTPLWKILLASLSLTIAQAASADPVTFGFQLVPDVAGDFLGTGSITFSETPADGIYKFTSYSQFTYAQDFNGNAIDNTMTRLWINFGHMSFPFEDVFHASSFDITVEGGYLTDISGTSKYFDTRPEAIYSTLRASEGSYNLWIYDTNLNTIVSQDGSIVFDQVAQPVPEPSTYALLGLGLLAIGWNARRRPAAAKQVIG